MPELYKAHCPHCDGERACDIHGKVEKPWLWEDREGHSANGQVDHSLLECRGCQTIFYETSSWDSESIEYWYTDMNETKGAHPISKITHPKPKFKDKPIWVNPVFISDLNLNSILTEIYTAYENNCSILTTIGLRTVIDRCAEIFGIDPAITFAEKLTKLENDGRIGETEKNILSVVTDGGNAAAHRGWHPSDDDLAKLIQAIEVFLKRSFVVGSGVLEIGKNIPPKPKRIAKTPAA